MSGFSPLEIESIKAISSVFLTYRVNATGLVDCPPNFFTDGDRHLSRDKRQTMKLDSGLMAFTTNGKFLDFTLNVVLNGRLFQVSDAKISIYNRMCCSVGINMNE